MNKIIKLIILVFILAIFLFNPAISSAQTSAEDDNQAVKDLNQQIQDKQASLKKIQDQQTVYSQAIAQKQKEAKAGSAVYKEIPIMVTAKAGYHEVGRFIASLENSDRFMKVVDIQIKADRALPRKHDVELLVVTYVLLEGR